MRNLAIMMLFVFKGAAGQSQDSPPLSVCDVLQRLDTLSDQEIRVRGAWAVGDMGQLLVRVDPCGRRTIRDEWVWRDAIQVYPRDREAETLTLTSGYKRMRDTLKTWTDPGRILATLSGRIETRGHFQIQTMVDGSKRPKAFGPWVAILRFHKVEDLEIAHYETGDYERVLDILQRPWAKRVLQK